MGKHYVKLLLSLLIFSTNGLLVAHIPLSSAEIVLARAALGGLMLLGVLLARGGMGEIRSLLRDRAGRRRLLPVLLGGAFLGANWAFLFEAYRWASVSIGTLLYYCAPILLMLLSPVLFREKLGWRQLVAIAAMALGMLCITGSGGEVSTRGIFCGILAAMFYTGVMLSNKFVRDVGGLESTFVQLITSFFVIILYLLLTGQGLSPMPDGKAWAAILTLGLVNTGLAYWLYFPSIQKLPGQTVALCSYLDPLFALLLAALVLRERMTALQLLGAVGILGGAVLGQLHLGRRQGAGSHK